MRWRASPLLLLLAACGGGADIRPGPMGARYTGYDRHGLASWYGDELRGARTATGELFDPEAITVAHRTLPLGSVVEVAAMDTGRTILARVADRGPGRGDQLVDLSHGAARLLGTDRRSVAGVRVRAVRPTAAELAALASGRAVVLRAGSAPPRAAAASFDPTWRYIVQVASFASQARAQALAAAMGGAAAKTAGHWRVRVGPLSAADAQRTRDDAARRGYGDALILSAD